MELQKRSKIPYIGAGTVSGCVLAAIQDIVDYLKGEAVEEDHAIACENVVAENVDKYPSF